MLNQNISFKGEIGFKVTKPSGEVIYTNLDTQLSKNLLLDSFFTEIVNNESFLAGNVNIHVGTGTTAPAVGDTTLENKLADITASRIILAPEDLTTDFKYTVNYVASFPTGAVVGNVAEVGANFFNNTDVVHSRGLIKDLVGNPTTIPVTVNDSLEIQYKFSATVSKTDIQSVINVGGTDTTITLRVGDNFDFTDIDLFKDARFYETFTLDTAGNSGIGGGDSVDISPAYSVDGTTKKGTYTLNTLVGNFASGIQGISTDLGGINYQVEFNPALNKQNTTTFTLVFNKTFQRV